MGKLEKAKKLVQQTKQVNSIDEIFVNLIDVQKDDLHVFNYDATALQDIAKIDGVLNFDYSAMEMAVRIGLGEFPNLHGTNGINLKDDKALGSTLLLMLNVSIANLNNELKKTQTKMKHNCYTLIKDNSNVHFFSSAPAANEQEATENGQAIAHLYKETSKSI